MVFILLGPAKVWAQAACRTIYQDFGQKSESELLKQLDQVTRKTLPKAVRAERAQEVTDRLIHQLRSKGGPDSQSQMAAQQVLQKIQRGEALERTLMDPDNQDSQWPWISRAAKAQDHAETKASMSEISPHIFTKDFDPKSLQSWEELKWSDRVLQNLNEAWDFLSLKSDVDGRPDEISAMGMLSAYQTKLAIIIRDRIAEASPEKRSEFEEVTIDHLQTRKNPAQQKRILNALMLMDFCSENLMFELVSQRVQHAVGNLSSLKDGGPGSELRIAYDETIFASSRHLKTASLGLQQFLQKQKPFFKFWYRPLLGPGVRLSESVDQELKAVLVENGNFSDSLSIASYFVVRGLYRAEVANFLKSATQKTDLFPQQKQVIRILVQVLKGSGRD